eukprot:3473792-Amphidinium_carterae.4
MDRNWFLLYRPAGQGCDELVCTITGESVKLPPGESRIGEQDGELFVQTQGSGSLWVSDLLQHVPEIAEAPAEVCLTAQDDTRSTYRAYMTAYTDFDFKVVATGRSEPLVVLLHVHTNGFKCSKLFWQLPRLKESLFTGGLTGSEWFNSWYQHWYKRLDRLDIDHGWHLRRGCSARGRGEKNPALFYGESVKCHPHPSSSTLALMVLLPQWSEAKEDKNADMAASWLGFLKAIVSRVYPEGSEHSWCIHDDTNVAVAHGVCRGHHPVEMQVRSSVVQWVDPVHASRPWNQAFKKRNWDTEVSVVDFALFAQHGRASPPWLARQVAFLMARDIEQHIQEGIVPPDTEAKRPLAMSRSAKRQWYRAKLSKLALAIKPAKPQNATDEVIQYWLRCRSKDGAEATHIGLAVDASRTGKLQRMYGFMTLSGRGYWCPAMVPRSKRDSTGIEFTEHPQNENNWSRQMVGPSAHEVLHRNSTPVLDSDHINSDPSPATELFQRVRRKFSLGFCARRCRVLKDGGTEKGMHMGDEEALARNRERWANEATELVRLLHGAERNPDIRPEKTHHRKAYQWSCAVDQMLDVMCGKRLRHFVIGDELQGACPMTWPSLSLALDQGSDGWSSTWFLKSERICHMTFADPAHRCWNDVRQTLKDCGLWSSILALTAICNFDGGPWKDCRFFQEGQVGMQEFLTCSASGNSLFEEYRHWLIEDLDLVHRQMEPDLDDTIRLGLCDAFRRKIARVGLSRWFGIHES